MDNLRDNFNCQFTNHNGFNEFNNRFSLEKRLIWQEGAPEGGPDADPSKVAKHEITPDTLREAVVAQLRAMLTEEIRTASRAVQRDPRSSQEIEVGQKRYTIANEALVKLGSYDIRPLQQTILWEDIGEAIPDINNKDTEIINLMSLYKVDVAALVPRNAFWLAKLKEGLSESDRAQLQELEDAWNGTAAQERDEFRREMERAHATASEEFLAGKGLATEEQMRAWQDFTETFRTRSGEPAKWSGYTPERKTLTLTGDDYTKLLSLEDVKDTKFIRENYEANKGKLVFGVTPEQVALYKQTIGFIGKNLGFADNLTSNMQASVPNDIANPEKMPRHIEQASEMMQILRDLRQFAAAAHVFQAILKDIESNQFEGSQGFFKTFYTPRGQFIKGNRKGLGKYIADLGLEDALTQEEYNNVINICSPVMAETYDKWIKREEQEEERAEEEAVAEARRREAEEREARRAAERQAEREREEREEAERRAREAEEEAAEEAERQARAEQTAREREAREAERATIKEKVGKAETRIEEYLGTVDINVTQWTELKNFTELQNPVTNEEIEDASLEYAFEMLREDYLKKAIAIYMRDLRAMDASTFATKVREDSVYKESPSGAIPNPEGGTTAIPAKKKYRPGAVFQLALKQTGLIEYKSYYIQREGKNARDEMLEEPRDAFANFNTEDENVDIAPEDLSKPEFAEKFEAFKRGTTTPTVASAEEPEEETTQPETTSEAVGVSREIFKTKLGEALTAYRNKQGLRAVTKVHEALDTAVQYGQDKTWDDEIRMNIENLGKTLFEPDYQYTSGLLLEPKIGKICGTIEGFEAVKALISFLKTNQSKLPNFKESFGFKIDTLDRKFAKAERVEIEKWSKRNPMPAFSEKIIDPKDPGKTKIEVGIYSALENTINSGNGTEAESGNLETYIQRGEYNLGGFNIEIADSNTISISGNTHTLEEGKQFTAIYKNGETTRITVTEFATPANNENVKQTKITLKIETKKRGEEFQAAESKTFTITKNKRSGQINGTDTIRIDGPINVVIPPENGVLNLANLNKEIRGLGKLKIEVREDQEAVATREAEEAAQEAEAEKASQEEAKAAIVQRIDEEGYFFIRQERPDQAIEVAEDIEANNKDLLEGETALKFGQFALAVAVSKQEKLLTQPATSFEGFTDGMDTAYDYFDKAEKYIDAGGGNPEATQKIEEERARFVSVRVMELDRYEITYETGAIDPNVKARMAEQLIALNGDRKEIFRKRGKGFGPNKSVKVYFVPGDKVNGFLITDTTDVISLKEIDAEQKDAEAFAAAQREREEEERRRQEEERRAEETRQEQARLAAEEEAARLAAEEAARNAGETDEQLATRMLEKLNENDVDKIPVSVVANWHEAPADYDPTTNNLLIQKEGKVGEVILQGFGFNKLVEDKDQKTRLIPKLREIIAYYGLSGKRDVAERDPSALRVNDTNDKLYKEVRAELRLPEAPTTPDETPDETPETLSEVDKNATRLKEAMDDPQWEANRLLPYAAEMHLDLYGDRRPSRGDIKRATLSVYIGKQISPALSEDDIREVFRRSSDALQDSVRAKADELIENFDALARNKATVFGYTKTLVKELEANQSSWESKPWWEFNLQAHKTLGASKAKRLEDTDWEALRMWFNDRTGKGEILANAETPDPIVVAQKELRDKVAQDTSNLDANFGVFEVAKLYGWDNRLKIAEIARRQYGVDNTWYNQSTRERGELRNEISAGLREIKAHCEGKLSSRSPERAVVDVVRKKLDQDPNSVSSVETYLADLPTNFPEDVKNKLTAHYLETTGQGQEQLEKDIRAWLEMAVSEAEVVAALATTGANPNEELRSLPEIDTVAQHLISQNIGANKAGPSGLILIRTAEEKREVRKKLLEDKDLRDRLFTSIQVEPKYTEKVTELQIAEAVFIKDETYKEYDYPVRKADTQDFRDATSGRLASRGINPAPQSSEVMWNQQFDAAYEQLSNPAMRQVENRYLGPGTSTTRMENAITDLGTPLPQNFEEFATKISETDAEFKTFWEFAEKNTSEFAPAESTEAQLREAFNAALIAARESSEATEAEQTLSEMPEEMAAYVRERVKATPTIDKATLLNELTTNFAGKITVIGFNPLEDPKSTTYQSVTTAAVETKVAVLKDDGKKNELQESLTLQGVVDKYKFEEFVTLERSDDDVPNAQRVRSNYQELTDHYVAAKLEKLDGYVTPPTGRFSSAFNTDNPRNAATSISKDNLRQGWIRGKKYSGTEFAKWVFDQWQVSNSYKKPGKPTTRQSIEDTFGENEYVQMTLVFDYALTNQQIATAVERADAETIRQWVDASKKDSPFPESLDASFFLGWVNVEGGLGLTLESTLPTHDREERKLREKKIIKFLKDRLTESRVTEAINSLNEAPINDMAATTKGILNGSIVVEDPSVADIDVNVFMDAEDLGRLLRAHYKDQGQTVEISANKDDTHRHERYRAVALAAFEEKFEHFKGEGFKFEDAGDMQSSWLLTIDKYNLMSYAPDSFAIFQVGGRKRIDIADELDVKIGELMTEAITSFANEYLRDAVNKNTLAALKFRRYFAEPEGNKDVTYSAESFYRAIAEKPLTDTEGKEAQALQYITHILDNFNYNISLDDKVSEEGQAIDALFLYSGDVTTVTEWLDARGKVWQEFRRESKATEDFIKWFKEQIAADGRTLPDITDTEIQAEITNRLRKAAVEKKTSLNEDRLEDVRLAEHNELTPEEFKQQLTARVKAILLGSEGAYEGDSRARGGDMRIELSNLLGQLAADFPQNPIEENSEAYFLVVDTALDIKLAQATADTDPSKWPDNQYASWIEVESGYGLEEYTEALEKIEGIQTFAETFAADESNLTITTESPFQKLQAAFDADTNMNVYNFNDPLVFHTLTEAVRIEIETTKQTAIDSVAPGPGKRRRLQNVESKFKPEQFAAEADTYATYNLGEAFLDTNDIVGKQNRAMSKVARNVVAYGAMTEIATIEENAYPHAGNAIGSQDMEAAARQRAEFILFDGNAVSYNTSNYFNSHAEKVTGLNNQVRALTQATGVSIEAANKIEEEFQARETLRLIDGLLVIATQPDKIADKEEAINTWVDQAKLGQKRIKIDEFTTWAQAKYSLPAVELNDDTKDAIQRIVHKNWRDLLNEKTEPLRLALDKLGIMAFSNKNARAWNTWRVSNGEEPINNFNKKEVFKGPKGLQLAESFTEWALTQSEEKDEFGSIEAKDLKSKRKDLVTNLTERDYAIFIESADVAEWTKNVRKPKTKEIATRLLQDTSLRDVDQDKARKIVEKIEVQMGITDQAENFYPNLAILQGSAAGGERQAYFTELVEAYIDPEANGVTPGALSAGRLNDFSDYDDFVDQLGTKLGYLTTDEFKELKTNDSLRELFNEKQKEQAKQTLDKDAIAEMVEQEKGLAKEIYLTIGRDTDASSKISEFREKYNSAATDPAEKEQEISEEIDPIIKKGIVEKTVTHIDDATKDILRDRHRDDTTNAMDSYRELVTTNSYLTEDEYDTIVGDMGAVEQTALEKTFFLEVGLDRSPNKIDGDEFFRVTENLLRDIEGAGEDIPTAQVDRVRHFRAIAKLRDAMKDESRYGRSTQAELGQIIDGISIDDQNNTLSSLIAGNSIPNGTKLEVLFGQYEPLVEQLNDVLDTHREELTDYRTTREQSGDTPHYSEMEDYLADLNVTSGNISGLFGNTRETAEAILAYQAVRENPLPSQTEMNTEEDLFARAQEKLRSLAILDWTTVEANVRSAGENKEPWIGIQTDTGTNLGEAIKSQSREKKEEMVQLYFTGRKNIDEPESRSGYFYKHLDEKYDASTDAGREGLRALTIEELRNELVNDTGMSLDLFNTYFNLEEIFTKYQTNKLGEGAVIDLVAGRGVDKITNPELKLVAESEKARAMTSSDDEQREALENITTLQEIDTALKDLDEKEDAEAELVGRQSRTTRENVIALAEGTAEAGRPLSEHLQLANDTIQLVISEIDEGIQEYIESAYADIQEVLNRDPNALTDTNAQTDLRAAQFVLTDLLEKVADDNGIAGSIDGQLDRVTNLDALQTAAYLAETYGETEQTIDRILPDQLDGYLQAFVSNETNLEIFSDATRVTIINPALEAWQSAPEANKEEAFKTLKQALLQELSTLGSEKAKDAHVKPPYRFALKHLTTLLNKEVREDEKAKQLYVIAKLLTTAEVNKPTPKLSAREKRAEQLDIKEAQESIYQGILLEQQRGVDALSETGKTYLRKSSVDFSNFQNINPEAFNTMFDLRAGTFITGEYVEKAAGTARGLFEAGELGRKDTIRFGDLLIHEFYDNDLTPEDDNFKMPFIKDISIQDPQTAERIFFRKYDALQGLVGLQKRYEEALRGLSTPGVELLYDFEEWKKSVYLPAMRKAARHAYGKAEYKNIPSSAKKLLEEGKMPGEVRTQIDTMDDYIISAYTTLQVLEEINQDIALAKLRTRLEEGKIDEDFVLTGEAPLAMRDLSEERVSIMRDLERRDRLYSSFQTGEVKGNAYVPTFRRHELHTDGKLADSFALFGIDMTDNMRSNVLDGHIPGEIKSILSIYKKISKTLKLDELENPEYGDFVEPLTEDAVDDLAQWIGSISIGTFEGLSLNDADKALLQVGQIPANLTNLFAGLKELHIQVEESKRLEYPRRWMKESYLPSVRAALEEFNMPPLTGEEEKKLMTEGILPARLQVKIDYFNQLTESSAFKQTAKESWNPIADAKKIERARKGLYIPEAMYEGNNDPRTHKDMRFGDLYAQAETNSSLQFEDRFKDASGPYEERLVADNYEDIPAHPFTKSHESISVSKQTRDAFIEGMKSIRKGVVEEKKEVVTLKKEELKQARERLKQLRQDPNTPKDTIDAVRTEVAVAQAAVTRAERDVMHTRTQTTQMTEYFRNHPEAVARVLYAVYGKAEMRSDKFFKVHIEEVEVDGDTVHRYWPILDVQQSVLDELFSASGDGEFKAFLKEIEVSKPTYTQIRTREQEITNNRNPFIPENVLVMDQEKAAVVRMEATLEKPDVEEKDILSTFMDYVIMHEVRDAKRELPTRSEMREGATIYGTPLLTISRNALGDRWFEAKQSEETTTQFLDSKLEHGIASVLMVMSYPDSYDYATILDEDTVETLAYTLYDLRSGRNTEVDFGGSAIKYLQDLQDSDEPILTQGDFINMDKLGEKEMSVLATVMHLGAQYENDVIGLVEQKEAVFAKYETPELVGVNVADIGRVQDRMFTSRGKILTPEELDKILGAIQQQIDTNGIGTLRLSKRQFQMGEDYENFRSLMTLANVTDTNKNSVIDGEEATVWVQQVVSQYNDRVKTFLEPLLPEEMRDADKMNDYLRTYAEIQLKKKELTQYPFGVTYVTLSQAIAAKEAAGEKVPFAQKQRLKRLTKIRDNNPDLIDETDQAQIIIDEIANLNATYPVINGSGETPLEALDRILYYGFVDIIMSMIQEDSKMATDFFASLGVENMNLTNQTAAFNIEVGHLIGAKEDVHLFYGGIISPTPSTYVGISKTETDMGPRKRGELTVWTSVGGGIGSYAESDGAPNGGLLTVEAGVEHRTRFDDGKSVLGGIVGRVALGDASAAGFEAGVTVYGGVEHLRPEELEEMIAQERLEAAKDLIQKEFERIDANLESDSVIAKLPEERRAQVKDAIRKHVEGIIRKEATRVAMPEVPRFGGIYWGFEASGTARGIARFKGHLYVKMVGGGQTTTTFEAGAASTLLEASDVRTTQELTDKGITSGGFTSQIPMELETQEDIARLMEGDWEQMVQSIGETRILYKSGHTMYTEEGDVAVTSWSMFDYATQVPTFEKVQEERVGEYQEAIDKYNEAVQDAGITFEQYGDDNLIAKMNIDKFPGNAMMYFEPEIRNLVTIENGEILFDLSGNFPVIRKEVIQWSAERYGAETLTIFTFTSNPKKKRSEIAAAAGEFLFIENNNDDVTSAPVWKTTKHPDGRDTFGMRRLEGLGTRAVEEEHKRQEAEFTAARELAQEFDDRAGEAVTHHEVLSETQISRINEVLDLFVPPEKMDQNSAGLAHIRRIQEFEPDITVAELKKRRRLIEIYATISVFSHPKENIDGRTLLDSGDIDFRDVIGGEAQQLIRMVQDWYRKYAEKKELSETQLTSQELRYVLNAFYYATFFNIHRGSYDSTDYFVKPKEVFKDTKNLSRPIKSAPKNRPVNLNSLWSHPVYQPMRNYIAHLRGSAYDMATGMAETYVQNNLEKVQADFPGKSEKEIVDIIADGLIAKMDDIPEKLVAASGGDITPEQAQEYVDYIAYYNMSKNGYQFNNPDNAEDMARRRLRTFSASEGRRITRELLSGKVQRAFYIVYQNRFDSKLDTKAREYEKYLPSTASARSYAPKSYSDKIDTPEGPKEWYVEGGRGSVTLAPEFGDDNREDQVGGMRYTKEQDLRSKDTLERHTSRTIFEYFNPRLDVGKGSERYNPSRDQFFLEYGTKNIVGQIRNFDEDKAQEKAGATTEAKEKYERMDVSYLDVKVQFAQNFGINIVKWSGLLLPGDENNEQATRLQELFWKVYGMDFQDLQSGLDTDPNSTDNYLTTEEKETFTEFLNLMTIFQELEYFDYDGDDEAFNMAGLGGDDYEIQVRYIPVDLITNGTEELIEEAKERLTNATDDAMFQEIAEEYLGKHTTFRRTQITRILENMNAETDPDPDTQREKRTRFITTILEDENKPDLENTTTREIAGQEENVVPFAFISKVGDNGERSKPVILNVSAIAFQATFPKCGNWLVGAHAAFEGGMMTIKPPAVPDGPRAVKVVTRDTHTTEEDLGYGTMSAGGALGFEVPTIPEDPPGVRTGDNKENEEGNDGADQDNPDVPDQTRPVDNDDPEDPERTTRLTDEERTPKFVGDARLGSIGKPSRGGVTVEREHEIEEKDERAKDDEDESPSTRP